MKVRLFSVCLLLWGCVACHAEAASLDEYGAPEAGSVRVIRDKYGVPHIIARDLPSMYYGAGYCQAQDQLENLALNMLRGQGKSAEHDGFQALPLDHLTRSLDLPGRAKQMYARLDDEERETLDAFVAGINDYLSAHRDNVADWIQPVSPDQVLAFSEFVDLIFSASHCQNDLTRAGIRIGSRLELPRMDAASFGSNQFAVAPSRSANGSAMLSMDPHLPHIGFYRWYEMHLVGPDVNVMGACFYGLPFIGMGRTERSAWCMTVNGPDLGDVFTFERDPSDPTRLKDIDGWKQFEISQETYRVKTPGGVIEMKLPRQSSPVGPVMTTKENTAYAFALPLSDSPQRSSQMLAMARARNVGEFRQSLKPLGLVMFNILYADTDGDIFIISNARLPRRDTRIDNRDLRPGDQEWARWQGYHDIEELPQVLNPPCGYLLNTNSGPQNVTEDVAPRPEDFPPYFMSQQRNSRWRRLSSLLSADKSLTWQAMHTYATDTHLVASDEYVPRIVKALEGAADASADQAPILAEVRTVLSNWDRRSDLDSQGAVLFQAILKDRRFQKAVGEDDQAGMIEAILAAAAEVRQQFGNLGCTWGQFSRIRRGDIELGIAGNGARDGALDRMGMTALRPTAGEVRDGRRLCQGGTSYAMLVDFNGRTRAMSILPFGVSEHPDSPHFADQLPLYVEGRYKPAWFWPDEVSENSLSDQVLTAAALAH